eukprot:2909961-Karenia_brevis.AAC.1
MKVLFGEGEGGAEKEITSTMTYLQALKAVMHTMVLAGTYQVARPGTSSSQENVFFCPLDPVIEYLACIDTYVLKYTSGGEGQTYSDADVLSKIRNIDEMIRSEWCRLLRNNEPPGVTMGEVIRAARNYSSALLLMQPN